MSRESLKVHFRFSHAQMIDSPEICLYHDSLCYKEAG